MADNEHLDATPEELLAAEALRSALEEASENGAENESADFLRSLKAAYDPAPLDARTNDALIERALATPPKKKQREGVVIRVTFGAAAVLAMAAALLLVFGRLSPAPPSGEKPELARVRSTAPLFDHPFDSKETSVRVDRIAMARASDLRENRFAQWGVR